MLCKTTIVHLCDLLENHLVISTSLTQNKTLKTQLAVSKFIFGKLGSLGYQSNVSPKEGGREGEGEGGRE